MTHIFAEGGFSIGLPIAVLLGSVLVSRLLRLSLLGTMVAASAPLGLPFVDLPFARHFAQENPDYIIGGGWAIMLCLALGWVAVRPVVSGAAKGIGAVRFAYLALLSVALLLVTVLMVNPEVLNSYAPDWRGSAGFVLLSVSLLSMSLALARVLRAALFFTLWSFVSIVLASELFLHKLPQDVVREDLGKIQSMIPSDKIRGLIDRLDSRSTSAGDSLKAFVLGGSPSTGFAFDEERSLSGRVRSLLKKEGREASVHDASFDGASVFDLHQIAQEHIKPRGADLVFIVGWAGDKERASEDLAISPTPSEVGWYTRLTNRVASSRVYRYLRGFGDSSDTNASAPRVSPSQYREELGKTVRTLRESGASVVLISEPTVSDEDRLYRDAMVATASQERALYVPAEQVLREANDPVVFGRGTLVSSVGVDLLAHEAVGAVRRSEVAASEPAAERTAALGSSKHI